MTLSQFVVYYRSLSNIPKEVRTKAVHYSILCSHVVHVVYCSIQYMNGRHHNSLCFDMLAGQRVLGKIPSWQKSSHSQLDLLWGVYTATWAILRKVSFVDSYFCSILMFHRCCFIAQLAKMWVCVPQDVPGCHEGSQQKLQTRFQLHPWCPDTKDWTSAVWCFSWWEGDSKHDGVAERLQATHPDLHSV